MEYIRLTEDFIDYCKEHDSKNSISVAKKKCFSTICAYVHFVCVCCFFQLMLDSWNSSIFCNIKRRLQDSAMKLVHAERNGEAFDSQLVIGVRESYGKPSSYNSIF